MKRNMTIVDFFKKKSKPNESSVSESPPSSSSSSSTSNFPSPSPSTSASYLPSSSPSTSISVPVPEFFEDTDIVMFLGKKMNIFQKIDALNNVYVPNPDFVFPKN